MTFWQIHVVTLLALGPRIWSRVPETTLTQLYRAFICENVPSVGRLKRLTLYDYS